MRPLQVGLVLSLLQDPGTGNTPSWDYIREEALSAEDMGFDTVWVPDELLWRVSSWDNPVGWWECVAMAGAVAAATSRIGVGTWVLSALTRNPGLTAKVAATLDEISGGRFILGFGSGHSGAQGREFGYPPDRVVGRYEEALEIVVPLLREGKAGFAGEFHRADGLEQLPPGPRPGGIPLMLGGHGPRTIGLAARYADVWSAYATESSHPEAFTEMLGMVDRACDQAGRDPETMGRSVGVFVEAAGPSDAEQLGLGVPLSGTPQQVAEEVHAFAELGVTRLEFVLWPKTPQNLEKAGQILEILDG